jgi:N utilization substance protein B
VFLTWHQAFTPRRPAHRGARFTGVDEAFRRAAEATKLEQVATQIWDDLAVEPAEREIASGLIRTYVARRERIDAILADVTTNWRLDRLGVIDRCVLRMGAAELERGETPAKVVIQEAVTIAERYSGVRSAKFVNGVLDALARRVGRLGSGEWGVESGE